MFIVCLVFCLFDFFLLFIAGAVVVCCLCSCLLLLLLLFIVCLVFCLFVFVVCYMRAVPASQNGVPFVTLRTAEHPRIWPLTKTLKRWRATVLFARLTVLCPVPIIEPEVLMDGKHDILRAAEATARVQAAVVYVMHRHKLLLEGILLKPNMVRPGASAKPVDAGDCRPCYSPCDAGHTQSWACE